jgi:hypothetical protein
MIFVPIFTRMSVVALRGDVVVLVPRRCAVVCTVVWRAGLRISTAFSSIASSIASQVRCNVVGSMQE